MTFTNTNDLGNNWYWYEVWGHVKWQLDYQVDEQVTWQVDEQINLIQNKISRMLRK